MKVWKQATLPTIRWLRNRGDNIMSNVAQQEDFKQNRHWLKCWDRGTILSTKNIEEPKQEKLNLKWSIIRSSKTSY